MSICRRTLLLSTCAGFAGAITGHEARAASTIIKLGQSLPLTGPHAVLGTAYRAAAVAAFKELSGAANGGGPQVELVSVDDGGQPERTAINAKLLAGEGVHALYGFVGAGADRVGSRAAAAEGLPYVAPVSGSVELRSARSPSTFTFRPSHADEIRYIARHAKLINVTKLALVYEYNFMGWELRDTVVDLMEIGNTGNVTLTSIDRDGSQYSVPGAVEVILAKMPQAIILGSNPVASASFVRAVRAAGFKGYLYALSSVGSQGLDAELGSLVAGVSVTQVVPFALSRKTAVSREHRVFCERNKLTPSSHSMEAWLAARLFYESAKHVKTPSPASIADALRSSRPVKIGDYTAQWASSTTSPRETIGLAVYDRHSRLIE